MTGPVGNINQPPGFTRTHFPKFTFSVHAIEDTINLSSNQLKSKMYYTPVVVHTFGYFTSSHKNVVPQKRSANPFSIMSMESVAGYYLGARDAPLGVRFLRNFSLGVWKFGQLPIDVIQIVGLGV